MSYSHLGNRIENASDDGRRKHGFFKTLCAKRALHQNKKKSKKPHDWSTKRMRLSLYVQPTPIEAIESIFYDVVLFESTKTCCIVVEKAWEIGLYQRNCISQFSHVGVHIDRRGLELQREARPLAVWKAREKGSHTLSSERSAMWSTSRTTSTVNHRIQFQPTVKVHLYMPHCFCCTYQLRSCLHSRNLRNYHLCSCCTKNAVSYSCCWGLMSHYNDNNSTGYEFERVVLITLRCMSAVDFDWKSKQFVNASRDSATIAAIQWVLLVLRTRQQHLNNRCKRRPIFYWAYTIPLSCKPPAQLLVVLSPTITGHLNHIATAHHTVVSVVKCWRARNCKLWRLFSRWKILHSRVRRFHC